MFSPQPPEHTCEHPSQSHLCSVIQGFLPLGRKSQCSSHLTPALHELSLPPTCLSSAPRDSYSPSYTGFLAALRHILLLGLYTSCSFPESQATDIPKAISLTSGLWSSVHISTPLKLPLQPWASLVFFSTACISILLL